VINTRSSKKRSHWLPADTQLPPEFQNWLGKAKEVPGSWWDDWSKWLRPQAGAWVNAPRSPGRAPYKAIEPAPGRYVKAKAVA
jgi:polyhydroxyalkanoate synthase